MKLLPKVLGFLTVLLWPQLSLATSSAELYTSKAYGYGRFEARLRFTAGNGVVSSFFLWKDGSEQTGAYWNELDFEKVGANCHLESNAIYGSPSTNHNRTESLQADLCGAYHTYAYEWTPDTIVWLVDGAEVRRETGAIPTAFAQNAATAGMQMHFNVWPGDSSFGGVLDPSILPVHEYIDWVQFSAFENGAFSPTPTFREDFGEAALADGWLTGSWSSPKNKSTHAPENVNLLNGYAVLSITADNALGPTGAMPGGPGASGSGGAAAAAGASSGGAPGTSGAPGGGGASPAAGAPGSGGTSALGGGPASSSGGTSSGAAAGAVAGGGTVSAAGSMSTPTPTPTPTPTENGASCRVGPPSPREGTVFWAVGLSALAFCYRRARRASTT